ncbi:hypothetical protein BJY00DRAFT_285912 [Aspergillus carlsbadensis]|nr:hypothetical protein BJY00DRAFT_285912 [Aspergillus carlsbadensis]
MGRRFCACFVVKSGLRGLSCPDKTLAVSRTLGRGAIASSLMHCTTSNTSHRHQSRTSHMMERADVQRAQPTVLDSP